MPRSQIRIRATDRLGNVAYVYERGGEWRCALANGTPAAFSYAGFGPDEMQVKFALEDCGGPQAALDVCMALGSRSTRYEIV